jgi:hypothetical protein
LNEVSNGIVLSHVTHVLFVKFMVKVQVPKTKASPVNKVLKKKRSDIAILRFRNVAPPICHRDITYRFTFTVLGSDTCTLYVFHTVTCSRSLDSTLLVPLSDLSGQLAGRETPPSRLLLPPPTSPASPASVRCWTRCCAC